MQMILIRHHQNLRFRSAWTPWNGPLMALTAFLFLWVAVGKVIAGDILTVSEFVKYRDRTWRNANATNAVTVLADVKYLGRAVITTKSACECFELSDKSGSTGIVVYTNPQKPGAYSHDKYLSQLKSDARWIIKGVPWAAPNMARMTFTAYKGRSLPAGKPFAVDIQTVQPASKGTEQH